MPQPIAIWNPARGVWEVPETESLICGHSELFSATWPSSGTTRNGWAYVRRTSVPRTDGSGSLSLLPTPDVPTGGEKIPPGARQVGATWLREDGTKVQVHLSSVAETVLLKTPTSQLAVNGGSQHPDKRKAGGHGPTLADEIEHLLPTPQAADGERSSLTMYRGEGNPTLLGALASTAPTATPDRSEATTGPLPLGAPTESTPIASSAKGAGDTSTPTPATIPLLPTPAVNDMGEGKTVKGWDEWTATQKAKHGNGNGHGASLAIEALRLLPTPGAADAKGVVDHKGGNLTLAGTFEPDRVAAHRGALTNPPSDAGSASPDE